MAGKGTCNKVQSAENKSQKIEEKNAASDYMALVHGKGDKTVKQSADTKEVKAKPTPTDTKPATKPNQG